ncbi:flagellar hook-associated protein FlgK [Alicyclobacillus mali (ex Roth et al. 2021)]|uniref:flagellar hook-associated protein FlgK n=1 Tax=Alicyclobacillus mali (ex Roth et al. 2021) TaxID=1123961 RepID=UPI001A8EA95F|nr:flagellar hook-associated protein FlgK [Alicyclobacillus mali (ex Roth et al. 2021)]
MGIPTFSPLYIGLSGLQAMQEAESVVGNNIDNANTPGYAQETVDFVESDPYPPVPGYGPSVGGQFGQGVSVQSVTRQDSWFYDVQDRNNQGQYEFYSTESSVLTQIEGILNEPSSTSLQNAMDQFFSAWETLSNDPSDSAAREAVISQGNIVAQTFNVVMQQLEQLQQNTLNTAQGQVAQLNQYAQQLADVQKQIQSVQQYGENPNQLLDQQDEILDQMSKLANLTLVQNADGTVDVSVGSGSNAVQLVSEDTSTNEITVNPLSASNLSSVQQGDIGGNMQGYEDVTQTLANLDAFLQTFSSAVNQQSGVNFFQYTALDTTNSSGEFSGGQLGVAVTSDQLQPTSSQPSGDNSSEIAVVNLQTSPVQNLGGLQTVYSYTYNDPWSGTASTITASVSGTFDQALGGIVSGIGMQASGVSSSQTTANALLQQSSQLRQSISGVSIDEQASYMIAYQNAYAAAAKYIATFQTMINSLLNMVQS